MDSRKIALIHVVKIILDNMNKKLSPGDKGNHERRLKNITNAINMGDINKTEIAEMVMLKHSDVSLADITALFELLEAKYLND